MDLLKRFDGFQKAQGYAQVRTLSGATVSIIAAALMLILFISEVVFWQRTVVENHILVDTSQGEREFEITLDVVFPSLSCKDIALAAEDAKGVPYDESRMQITKTAWAPKRPFFQPAGSLADAGAGAGAGGCRLQGTVRVRKVAGVLYVAAPRTLTNIDGRLAFTVAPDTMASYNASHVINSLTFGPAFPGQVNALSGVVPEPQAATGSWQYHIRVVPTVYEYLYGSVVDSQQYSVSEFVQTYDPGAGGMGMIHPGVWWKFDFSPILVRLVETKRSFAQFLVSVCAITGGLYALSGIIDQVFWRCARSHKE